MPLLVRRLPGGATQYLYAVSLVGPLVLLIDYHSTGTDCARLTKAFLVVRSLDRAEAWHVIESSLEDTSVPGWGRGGGAHEAAGVTNGNGGIVVAV